MGEHIRPFKVKPVGSGLAFGDGPDFAGFIEVPRYPRSQRGEALRARQIALGLGLMEAAHRLGLTVVEYSAICRGSMTLSDEDWNVAMLLIEGL